LGPLLSNGDDTKRMEFVGIYIESDPSNPNTVINVHHNVISNLYIHSGNNNQRNFAGIYHKVGYANIYNNVIGTTDPIQDALTFNHKAYGGEYFGILSKSGHSNIKDNFIAGFQFTNAYASSYNIYGIAAKNVTGGSIPTNRSILIEDNTVVHPDYDSTFMLRCMNGYVNCTIVGIYIDDIDTFNIKGNSINNIYNAHPQMVVSEHGSRGIQIANNTKVGTIELNSIKNIISLANYNSALYPTACGIYTNSTSLMKLRIRNNYLYNINAAANTSSLAVRAVGILDYNTPVSVTDTILIDSNFINGVNTASTSSASNCIGIYSNNNSINSRVLSVNNVILLNNFIGSTFGMDNVSIHRLHAHNNTIVLRNTSSTSATNHSAPIRNAWTAHNNVLANYRTSASSYVPYLMLFDITTAPSPGMGTYPSYSNNMYYTTHSTTNFKLRSTPFFYCPLNTISIYNILPY